MPANWREVMAAGDEKALQYLNRYASPQNVVKALLNTRNAMNDHAQLRARPEGDANDPAHQQAMREWRAHAGIPEEPAGYLENMPEGLVVGEEDQELVNTFVESMHQADAPPAYVHQGLQWYYQTQEAQIAQQIERDREAHRLTDTQLRERYGPEYLPNMNHALNTWTADASRDLWDNLASARMPDGTLVGDNVEFVDLVVNWSKRLNPHGTVTPSAGQTPMQTIDAELGELRKEMADTNSDYYKSDAKQARYRELLEIKSNIEVQS